MDRRGGHAAVARNHTENLPMLKTNNSPPPGELALDGLHGSLEGRDQFHRSYYWRKKESELNTGAAAVLGHTRTTMTNERAPNKEADRLPESLLKHSSGTDAVTLVEVGDSRGQRRKYTTLGTPGNRNCSGELRDPKF